MILLVPYFGELHPMDQRLVQIANLLGIDPVLLPLAEADSDSSRLACLDSGSSNCSACLVVNPAVFETWTKTDRLPDALASFLLRRFSHLVIHVPRQSSFDATLIQVLSGGQLDSVRAASPNQPYEINADSRDICEGFAGVSFAPLTTIKDQVFPLSSSKTPLRSLMTVAGSPLMAVSDGDRAKVWFLASPEVADLNALAGDAYVSDYFSRLMPYAMALRSIFGVESFRPPARHASVVIDDPLLNPEYGALNFESLLALMKQENFHTTIAFIPHNYKRSSQPTITMLRENPRHFSICFHGNDHTKGEFASTSPSHLNALLSIAERRIDAHTKSSGLECDRVMVFPQGGFSVEAMEALKSHNFDGAVNTVPHPMGEPASLTLRDVVQPGVLRFGNSPLFLRKSSVSTRSEDVAFNCFFGRPVLIVEHHQIFQEPELLIAAVRRINAVAPDIRWTNLGTIVKNAVVWKRTPEGVAEIRAYAPNVQLSNDSPSARRYAIEWGPAALRAITGDTIVLRKGVPFSNFASNSKGIRVQVDLPAGDSTTLSVSYPRPQEQPESLGIQHNAKAFIRRRLSELRDNHLSKNPRILAAAKAVQRSLVH